MKNFNKGIMYDKMIQEKSDDELGLFDKKVVLLMYLI